VNLLVTLRAFGSIRHLESRFRVGIGKLDSANNYIRIVIGGQSSMEVEFMALETEKGFGLNQQVVRHCTMGIMADPAVFDYGLMLKDKGALVSGMALPAEVVHIGSRGFRRSGIPMGRVTGDTGHLSFGNGMVVGQIHSGRDILMTLTANLCRISLQHGGTASVVDTMAVVARKRFPVTMFPVTREIGMTGKTLLLRIINDKACGISRFHMGGCRRMAGLAVQPGNPCMDGRGNGRYNAFVTVKARAGVASKTEASQYQESPYQLESCMSHSILLVFTLRLVRFIREWKGYQRGGLVPQ